MCFLMVNGFGAGTLGCGNCGWCMFVVWCGVSDSVVWWWEVCMWWCGGSSGTLTLFLW